MTPPAPLFIALTLAGLASVELAKTARWRELFGPDRPDFARCLRALVAGQLTNQLLPFRGGEVVRLGLITLERAPPAVATTALASAKALDALCLATLAGAIVGSVAAAWGSQAVAAVVLAGVAVLALSADRLRLRLGASRLARRLRVAGVIDAVSALRTPRSMAVVGATTAAVFLAGMGANAAVLAAVGLTPSVDVAARVLVAAYLIGFLPAPPGRLVVYEAGVSAALLSAGVEPSAAVAASVTLHACQLAELGILLALSLLLSRHLGRSSAPA